MISRSGKGLKKIITHEKTGDDETKEIHKNALGQEKGVKYRDVVGSDWFTFFRMFPDIIFRYYGSALPHIVIELLLAIGFSILAYGLTEDVGLWGLCPNNTCGALLVKDSWEKGHKFIGTLIAFLIILRTQIAWGMYWEGRGHIGNLVLTTRSLAIELLTSLCVACRDDDDLPEASPTGETNGKKARITVRQNPPAGAVQDGHRGTDMEFAVLALESVRYLKLFFWSIVEHVRSEEGEAVWRGANIMLEQFTTDAEWAELDEEFGGVQKGEARAQVVIPQMEKKSYSDLVKQVTQDISEENKKKAFLAAGGNIQTMFDELVPDSHKEKTPEKLKEKVTNDRQALGSNAKKYPRANIQDTIRRLDAYFKRSNEPKFRDPTRAKPLVIMTWLKLNMQRMFILGALQPQQHKPLSELTSELIVCYNGIDKIQSMVLPLPYCQLLKLFMLFFVYSLPFVIAVHAGPWTPCITVIAAMGYFGLDEVAKQIECPFGVDENDFPMLAMGLGLVDDLDALVKSVGRPRAEQRTLSSEELSEIRDAAKNALGWGFSSDGWP